MTLKATSVSAVSLALTDGVEAYFVQHGPEWNTLRAYRCIAPAAFAGQFLIVAPDTGAGDLSMMFDKIMGHVLGSPIVMASPSLAVAMLAINAATKQAPPVPQPTPDVRNWPGSGQG